MDKANPVTHSADYDPPLEGGNLDLDFIDYPTGWAIQKRGLAHVDDRCSAVQTGGAMLCDCDALPTEWARLKTTHDGKDGTALAARYMSVTPPEMTDQP